LGEAHYPTSPLFGAAVLDDKMNPWARPAVAPASVDEDSALIQPLDSLDLGMPDAALDEFLNSQAAVQAPEAGLDMPPLDLDMPPLELDLPAVSSLNKAPDELVYALDTTTGENVADLIDDWAPLELPGTVDVQPALDIKDAPGAGGAHEVSEDDLAILGIEAHDDGINALTPSSVDVPFVESDFAEDMQAAQSEMAELSLDSAPLPLGEPAHDLSALNLEVEAVPEALPSSSIEPLELSLDLPMSAPVSSLQETLSAPMSSSGMMNEHEVKLDIASAYIDMGDPAGAREMLQEVLASDGDELLKHRANQMLSSLSA